MSSATQDLDFRLAADGKCGITLSPFEYHVGAEDSSDRIVIPAGFPTDFASVPEPHPLVVVGAIALLFAPWPWFHAAAILLLVLLALLSLFRRTGLHSKAALVHDWLYQCGNRTRAEADRIFLEFMEVLGVDAWQRYPMFAYVRLFGFLAWKRKQKARAV